MQLNLYINAAPYSYRWQSMVIDQDTAGHLSTAEFDLELTRGVSTFPVCGAVVAIQNPDTLDWIFTGKVVRVEPQQVVGNKVQLHVACQDYAYLLESTIITTAVEYLGQTDQYIIQALFAAYLPAINTGSVASTMALDSVRFADVSLRAALEQIVQLTGAVWYLDPDQVLQYFAPGAQSAAFSLSDTPDNVTSFPYLQNPSYTEEFSNACNFCTVLGAVQDDGTLTTGQHSEPASIAAYGTYARTIVDRNIQTDGEADLRAEQEVLLYAYPQIFGTVVFSHDGLVIGQSITITCVSHGMSGAYVTRKMRIQQITETRTHYTVEVGAYRPDLIWQLRDLANRAKQPTEIPVGIPAIPEDVTIISCTGSDDGNNQFIDVEYQPPGTDSATVGSFTSVNAYTESPDGSMLPQFAGGFSYDGDLDGQGEERCGTCRLVVPLTAEEDRRVYIVSRSAVYTNKLVLPKGTCDTNGTTLIRRTGPVFTGLTGVIYVNATLRTIASVTNPDNLELTENVGVHSNAKDTGIYTWSTGVCESPNALVPATASQVILNPPAVNQTPVTVGANKCRVVLVADNNRTKYQFAGSVTFKTSEPNYAYLTKFEVFADNAVGVASDQVLGYMKPPAAGQGDKVELFYTDLSDLPIGADDIWGLEFRAYNIDNLMTPDPPRVEGLIVPCDSTAPPPDVDPLAIPPVTDFSVSDWGMDAAQEFRLFVCTYTMPANMANMSALKFRIATPGLPGGQDVTGNLPYPKVAAGLTFTNGHMIQIARADLPSIIENWTFSAVSINAAGDGDNLAAPAPTDVLGVGPPDGIVPDLVMAEQPTSVVLAEVGPRFLGTYNEVMMTLRATVTLPVNHRATYMICWFSTDNGTTWTQKGDGWDWFLDATTGVIQWQEYVPKETATASWKVRVVTGNAQVIGLATPTESAPITVTGIGAPGTTGASAASVGLIRYSKDSDGVWKWGPEYVKWTAPTNDPNLWKTGLTVQLVSAAGSPAPGEAGIERVIDSTDLVGAEYTSVSPWSWSIPDAADTYRNFRCRIRVVNLVGGNYTYTGCWPAGANYFDLVPAVQTGAIQAQRSDPNTLGPEFSIGKASTGGTALLRQAAPIATNLLPNADFQLSHPTTANWADKWTTTGGVALVAGGESGDYCMRLLDQGALTSDKVRVVPGQQFNVTARLKATSGYAGSLYLLYQFWDSTGTVIETWGAGTYDARTPGTAWEDFGFSHTIPATAGSPAEIPYYITIVVYAGGDTSGKYVYVDRLQLTLVTTQTDEYSAGVTTAVTLGQHLNGAAQFVGAEVKRSTGKRVEVRDDHVTVYYDSGRPAGEIYEGYTFVKTDSASGYPWVLLSSGSGGSVCEVTYDGSTYVGLESLTGTGSKIKINGIKVVGPQQGHIANPTGGATVDTESRNVINSILTALETHGLLASS